MSDTLDLKSKIMEKVAVNKSGCWIWTGYLTQKGYGKVFFQKKRHLAHRMSYLVFKGELDTEKQLDHLCQVRNCVNPDHLEQVTALENIMRSKGVAVINSKKKKCLRGHEYTPGLNNRRCCKICAKSNRASLKARKAEKANHE